MQSSRPIDIANFFITGINYKKTDACTRGQFSINFDQYENILKLAPFYDIDSLFILSTCNRTEVYGFAEDPGQLIDLLCSQTTGDRETFSHLAYLKKGQDAVEHLFNVAAGLDSQILGDYEIIGQLKQAVKFSKERGFMNCFSERLFNYVLQSSKTIKNSTALSDGTISASFTAVQYIKENIQTDLANKKVLVVGIGKIGRNTCKNLVDYLGAPHITVINRSVEKAIELAAELKLNYATLDELPAYVDASDIILVATNATDPIIMKAQLENKGDKLIIDLSIPYNVQSSARELENITLLNVDELSKLKDATLQKRVTEVPKAKEIIVKHMDDFMDWCRMRKNAPVLNSIKTTLNEIYIQHQLLVDTEGTTIHADRKIQMVVNDIASKMRDQNQRGCHYIEAINLFMANGQAIAV
ncbi:glutamyl-tRNA reductase [uncultured Mucilaginibacter sp.]|uniref:glutamyl-tRNA reductase n=1 Tax=uncultured Mucilaginibacter sp. TaxID=797541 RepID=UPI0025DE8ADE|nr:glutamyl-tRNA reductase [uncultured Mucilaginibacter sp.]